MQFTLKEIEKITKGQLLQGQDRPVSSWCQDSRLVGKEDLFFSLRGDNFDGHQYIPDALAAGCRTFLIDKPLAQVEDLCQAMDNKVHGEAALDGRPAPDRATGAVAALRQSEILLVEDTMEALKELARVALARTGAKVAAVTGSTGKTSTRDMTACILATRYKVGVPQGNLNTPIGLSLTILGFGEDVEMAVAEMGMDRFGEIQTLCTIARPDVAMITNIGISHMENLGSREGIFRAKMEITSLMEKEDTLLISRGEDYLRKENIKGTFHLMDSGFEEDCDLAISQVEERGSEGISFTLTKGEERARFDLPVPGRHNALDAALAAGAGLAFGISLKESAAALAHLSLTQGRLKAIKESGITLLDDTYNASPDSTRAAIDVLASIKEGRRYALLSDMLELGQGESEEHYRIGQYALEKELDGLFVYGDRSRHTAQGAGPIGHHFADKGEAVTALLTTIQPGDTVLFKGSRGMHTEKALQAVRRALKEAQ